MRIVSGKFKGLRIDPPGNLPVRPTTDIAKESLFNILNNHFDFEEIRVLDLFSGTGNIVYELASRGCTDITSIDINFNCIRFIKQTVEKLKIEGVQIFKSDVFKFLDMINEKFDIIFADPPYDLQRIPELAETIIKKDLLNPDGWLIIEHSSLQKLDNLPKFAEQRIYGQSSFSIFINH
jgi:16S rRNA (guanine966-N2)-methyltransferase